MSSRAVRADCPHQKSCPSIVCEGSRMNLFVRWVAACLSSDRAGSLTAHSQSRLPSALAVAFLAFFAVSSAYAGDAPLAQNVLTEIQQLQVEKASRTPAQKKIDSQLLM